MASTNSDRERNLRDSLVGCLLGTAIGDSIGLPAEGLTRHRQQRIFGEIRGHRFLFGHGMVSDDTEHTMLVAQALIASAGAVPDFQAALARQLRVWFLMVPAGVGFATLRACLRLIFGAPPERSGVYSAGNGPAMRAALIGVAIGDDLDRLGALIHTSSRITHTDPRAEFGALAVALAAHEARCGTLHADSFVDRLRALLPANDAAAREVLSGIEAACHASDRETTAFAATLGTPGYVSGFVCHTVPVALHAALRHPHDLRSAVIAAVACGGDADSVAAIAGGIVGAAVGAAGIPPEWEAGLIEWPRSVVWMHKLAVRLAKAMETGQPRAPQPVNLPAVMARNLGFLVVVLAHGLRRLFPPY